MLYSKQEGDEKKQRIEIKGKGINPDMKERDINFKSAFRYDNKKEEKINSCCVSHSLSLYLCEKSALELRERQKKEKLIFCSLVKERPTFFLVCVSLCTAPPSIPQENKLIQTI